MTTYGITNDGFVLKRFEICKEEIEDQFREAFGNDINVDDESIFGNLINIFAKREADFWESQQAAYNATRPRSAVGAALDDLLAINGLTRFPATKSQCYITLYGDNTDVVDEGFTVSRSDDATTRFVLFEDTTISVDDAIEAQVDVTAAAAGDYTITIDSVAYTYTATGVDTEATITTGLAAILQAALSSDFVIEYDAVTNYRITIRPIDNITAFTVSLTGNLDYNTIGTLGLFYSENEGAVPAPATTLTVIETPDDADSVYNREPASLGRLEETDVECRIRRDRAFSGICSNLPALENRLIEEVDNVSFCRGFENDTDATDSEGRPPHSIEIVVVGGDNEAIAEKIFELKAGGIQTYGNTSQSVLDSNGTSHTIYFSRQVIQYAWIRYTIQYDYEQAFPSDGETQIKENAKSYCESIFTIGKDLIFDKMKTPVYLVDGVRYVSVEIAITLTPGGTPSYAASNILLLSKELPEFDEDRIIVLEA